jgi:hypothetical protein
MGMRNADRCGFSLPVRQVSCHVLAVGCRQCHRGGLSREAWAGQASLVMGRARVKQGQVFVLVAVVAVVVWSSQGQLWPEEARRGAPSCPFWLAPYVLTLFTPGPGTNANRRPIHHPALGAPRSIGKCATRTMTSRGNASALLLCPARSHKWIPIPLPCDTPAVHTDHMLLGRVGKSMNTDANN